MRQQLMRAGVIGVALAAASFVGAGGCDDVSTGHLADPAGPVRILRVLVQDAPAAVVQTHGEGGSTRGTAVDLLDHSAPVSCDDANPCPVLMAFGGGLGDFTCRKG